MAAVKPEPDPLRSIAREVVWWQDPETTLSDPVFFLCKVMALGTWEDIGRVEPVYGESAFRHALSRCRAGAMDARSWHYWHHRLGISPVPEMPRRSFA